MTKLMPAEEEEELQQEEEEKGQERDGGAGRDRVFRVPSIEREILVCVSGSFPQVLGRVELLRVLYKLYLHRCSYSLPVVCK